MLQFLFAITVNYNRKITGFNNVLFVSVKGNVF